MCISIMHIEGVMIQLSSAIVDFIYFKPAWWYANMSPSDTLYVSDT